MMRFITLTSFTALPLLMSGCFFFFVIPIPDPPPRHSACATARSAAGDTIQTPHGAELITEIDGPTRYCRDPAYPIMVKGNP